MSMNLNAEIETLKQMTVHELQDRYIDVFGERTRSNHKQYLIKRIAWRMQAQREGDLSTRARRRAMELADDADLRIRPPVERPSNAPSDGDIAVEASFHSPSADDRLPMPGTTLSREYKGRTINMPPRDWPIFRISSARRRCGTRTSTSRSTRYSAGSSPAKIFRPRWLRSIQSGRH